MTDLRSDTLTKPTDAMRAAIAGAVVGDDVYGEDPTVNELEQYAAEIMGKEAALYVTSGTQSNLLALLTHCGRGDEYIVGEEAHTYKFEGGGAASLGGIQPQPIGFEPDGRLAPDAVRARIKPDNFHFARTRLVCLENTHNGLSLELGYIEDMRSLCDEHGLAFHLDGARFFNAAADRQLRPQELARPFDTVSICLSKGLGAPVGSVLLGNADFIQEARRWRKVVGGGMRQAGIVAAGGLFALRNHRDRLTDDHDRAARVCGALRERFGDDAATQATNMVFVALNDDTYGRLKAQLLESGVKVERQRWVFHLDVSDADVDIVCRAISELTD